MLREAEADARVLIFGAPTEAAEEASRCASPPVPDEGLGRLVGAHAQEVVHDELAQLLDHVPPAGPLRLVKERVVNRAHDRQDAVAEPHLVEEGEAVIRRVEFA